jgi:hypothetical protein
VEETSVYRGSAIKLWYDTLTDILIDRCSITITCIDPNIARKSVQENNTQLLEWYWPADDESILSIVT